MLYIFDCEEKNFVNFMISVKMCILLKSDIFNISMLIYNFFYIYVLREY